MSTSPPKKRHFFLGFLFLILLLGGTVILSYPLGQKFSTEQQELQQQVDQLNAQVATLQKFQDNQAQLKARFNELSKQQQDLEKHLTALSYQIEQQPGNDDDWKLAEINYLLTIALHRLHLVHDPEGALAALSAANDRLQRLNKPALYQVRTRLLEDIQRLRDLKRPDIAGLAVRLARFAAQVDTLPLLQGTRQSYTPPVNEPANEQPWQQVVWKTLKQLVVIRHSTEADTGFLPPEQRSLVAQILQLKLENTRFFLLRRENQNFVASIDAVRDWVKRYYDQNDTKVKTLQKELTNMQTITLNPPLPDISGSLNLLTKNLSAETETP